MSSRTEVPEEKAIKDFINRLETRAVGIFDIEAIANDIESAIGPVDVLIQNDMDRILDTSRQVDKYLDNDQLKGKNWENDIWYQIHQLSKVKEDLLLDIAARKDLIIELQAIFQRKVLNVVRELAKEKTDKSEVKAVKEAYDELMKRATTLIEDSTRMKFEVERMVKEIELKLNEKFDKFKNDFYDKYVFQVPPKEEPLIRLPQTTEPKRVEVMVEGGSIILTGKEASLYKKIEAGDLSKSSLAKALNISEAEVDKVFTELKSEGIFSDKELIE